jgi:UDP-N-acetylglucosamine--N-acetylmuramyl-(pentapeptide) pyrophosphoryl-undecaprenol N-acetylglucosamine transferase
MTKNKEILSWHSLRVIVSGGGTGGHIFPALAIADRIKAESREATILFVGAQGRMEMQRVPAAGYEIKGLWISGLQRNLSLSNLMFPFKVLRSIRDARRIIKEFKPDVVIGVGGYASAPTLYAASRAGLPTLIQEQNSYPGITNRILSRRVDRICVAYDGLEKYFPREKIFLTGNPVREEISNCAAHVDEAFSHFRLDAGKPVLLVVGGSLGARTINLSVGPLLKELTDAGCQVIWQTGRSYYQEAQMVAAPFEAKGVRVFDFINRMDLAYAASTLVVSRAGAIALSELIQVGKPGILIPSPNVAEDHQTKNAMALVNHGAAIMVKDADAAQKLGPAVLKLLSDKELQMRLKENTVKLAVKDATGAIVSVIFQLMHDKGMQR